MAALSEKSKIFLGQLVEQLHGEEKEKKLNLKK